jgi:hypothetical protein
MDFDFAYCPVIKGKMNDIKAMSYVVGPVAALIKPLYELPPFLPTQTPEQVLARFATRLSKLNGSRHCYVDFPLLKPGAKTSSGEPALDAAFSQLNLLGVQFEPVYGFDRDESLWPLLVRQATRSGGMLLRLELDDVDFPEDTIEKVIDLQRYGLDLRTLDVMIDCRYIPSEVEARSVAAEVGDFIEKLATTTTTRKTLVAGSSAPKTVTAIEKNSTADVTRNELTLWATLATERLPVEPIYADYGVIHPDFSDLTASTHINGKIRYTEGTKFHIFRGHSLRLDDKFEQYRKLAAAVMGSRHYLGNTYSHGDRYIHDCATGHAGTGNPGTWVLVDQNHHVSYALNQLQKLRTLVARGYPAEAVLERA